MFDYDDFSDISRDENYGMKELYDVTIRTLAPLEIGDLKFETNEAVLTFKTAELATVDQIKTLTQAKGGYGNSPQINWERDKEVRFALSHGVLSPISWALLSNSKLNNEKIISVPQNEIVKVVEDDGFWFADLSQIPNSCKCVMGAQPNPCFEPLPMGRRPELMLKPLPPNKNKYIFIYDEETGKKIKDFEICGNRIIMKEDVKKIVADYTYDFNKGVKIMEIGNRLFNGFMSLSAKANIKSDITGEIETVLIKIPKIKINSTLSMRLGKQAEEPVVSNFYFSGYKEDGRDEKIWNLIFLGE